MPLSKKDKITELKTINIKKFEDLPDDILTYIHKRLNKPVRANKKPNAVDKTTELYKLRLKFVLKVLNKILKNMKKDPITKLNEFKEVDPDKLNSEANIGLLKELDPEIVEHFGDNSYNKKTKKVVFTLLRSMAKTMGFIFERIQKDIYNDKGFRRSVGEYQIRDV